MPQCTNGKDTSTADIVQNFPAPPADEALAESEVAYQVSRGRTSCWKKEAGKYVVYTWLPQQPGNAG